MSKIALIIEEKTGWQLCHAFEAFARCGMGQYDSLIERLSPYIAYEDKKQIEAYLRHAINDDNGYGMAECPNADCRAAWGAYQYLRRELSWMRDGKDWRTDKRELDMMTINYDAPMRTIDEPMRTERIEDKEAKK